MKNLKIIGGTLVTADRNIQKDFQYSQGEITFKEMQGDAEILDASGLLILPGLIDCHVHFREPGFPDKATMQSEAASAQAGGVTTVCEMPNTDPPTVTIAALADKVRRANEITNCDIRFFFGVTQAEHLITCKQLWGGTSEELMRLRRHCCGIKIYLDHSTGNQKASGEIVEDVFQACGEFNIPLVAHCEDAESNQKAMEANSITTIAAHSTMRPPESEERAIDFALQLAKKHNTPFHVAHLSTKQGLERISQAKKDGVRVTCEVAPHHLFLSTEDYKTLGALGKMNPPLRTPEHKEALTDGLIHRIIDCVSTDHAPHTFIEKTTGAPLDAPSGVPGVETMLPLLLTAASGISPHPNGGVISGLTYSIILDACFTRPNEIFHLEKTGISEGSSSRLVVIDPHEEWLLEAKNLHSHCKWTPYEGWKIQGKITRVLS